MPSEPGTEEAAAYQRAREIAAQHDASQAGLRPPASAAPGKRGSRS